MTTPTMTAETKALVDKVKKIQDDIHLVSISEVCASYKDSTRKSCSRNAWYNITSEAKKPTPYFSPFKISLITHMEQCIAKVRKNLNP